MTSNPLKEYPDPNENLHNRPICIYVTDIPKSFSKEDIEYIFDKISGNYLTVSSIEFAPCFYDPYDKKCAYVYFDHWFSASEEIANIECFFILNTFYEYPLSRTWFQYWMGEARQCLKFFYVKKPIRSQGIKENWKLIQQQNLFQEIRRQNIQIRALKKRIGLLENKMNINEEYDANSYHHIM